MGIHIIINMNVDNNFIIVYTIFMFLRSVDIDIGSLPTDSSVVIDNKEPHIPSFDELFMRHVYLIGSKSKDRSTQIGAVLVSDGGVISEGYNGICRKVTDTVIERNISPEKYHWFEHGERNAIYNAARKGIKTIGSIMFTNYTPCTDCARGIIQAGVQEVVFHKQWGEVWDTVKKEKWSGHDDRTTIMFNEAGIPIRIFDMILGVTTRISGKIYTV
jgi:dCMP deaminase